MTVLDSRRDALVAVAARQHDYFAAHQALLAGPAYCADGLRRRSAPSGTHSFRGDWACPEAPSISVIMAISVPDTAEVESCLPGRRVRNLYP